MVEFAIIMPLLFMLVLGMFTGGIVMNRQMALTHSTREAARYGATVPVDQSGIGDWAEHVRSVAIERSGNELQASDICVSLVDGPTNAASPIVVASTDGKPCIIDAARGVRVQVTARLEGQEINGVIMRVPLTLTSDATAKFEE